MPARPAVHAAALADKLYTPAGGKFVDSVLSRMGMMFSSSETTPAGVAVATEIAEAVRKDTLVVVGMKWNPECSAAVSALEAAGHTPTYLEYGGYTSMYAERLAVKMWSGWQLFPQVFVKGQLVGGLELTKKLIASGEMGQLCR